MSNLQEEIKESKIELEKAIEFLENRVRIRLEFLNNPEQHLTYSLKIRKISNMIFFYTKNIKLPIVENELGPDKKIIQWPELTESMRNLLESTEYYNKGLEYLENDMYSNILPYSANEGVIIDIMASNGLLNSREYINADLYNSEEFRNVIASSKLMTSALLPGAKEIVNDYDELLSVIDERVE